MAQLSREDLLKLANLARLDLSEAEISEFAAEISEILSYVEKLSSVDTGDLTPTNQVSGLINVSREDEVLDYGYEPLDLLKNVPEVEDNQLRVKRMIG